MTELVTHLSAKKGDIQSLLPDPDATLKPRVLGFDVPEAWN